MDNNYDYDPADGSQPHQPPHHPTHAQHTVPVAPKQEGRTGARSVEYLFLTIVLLTAAASLILLLIIWANGSLGNSGGVSFDAIAFPAAALIVALPVFAGLVTDLARAELKNPSLRLDLYKTRSLQFIKVVAFTTCFFALIALVYGIFLISSNDGGGSLSKLFADVLIILAVAGSILAYYLVSGRKS